jgi:hypothetical protein
MDTDPENPAYARRIAGLQLTATLSDIRAVESGLDRSLKLLEQIFERFVVEEIDTQSICSLWSAICP